MNNETFKQFLGVWALRRFLKAIKGSAVVTINEKSKILARPKTKEAKRYYKAVISGVEYSWYPIKNVIECNSISVEPVESYLTPELLGKVASGEFDMEDFANFVTSLNGHTLSPKTK